MEIRNVVRRTLDLIAGNWASRAYLAVTFALLVWAWADSAFVPHEDASFAGVVPALFTAPTSLLFILLPEGTPAGYFGVIAAAAVVNAAAIGLLVRVARRA